MLIQRLLLYKDLSPTMTMIVIVNDVVLRQIETRFTAGFK